MRGAMTDVKYVDDKTFESEVLNSTLPVLVDFSAAWCGPCLKQLPILEKFAIDNSSKIKVVKIDIDESPVVAAKFGIKSIPSMLLFNQGKKLDMKVGLTSAAILNKWVSDQFGI
jgi:thioredoxin 1